MINPTAEALLLKTYGIVAIVEIKNIMVRKPYTIPDIVLPILFA